MGARSIVASGASGNDSDAYDRRGQASLKAITVEPKKRAACGSETCRSPNPPAHRSDFARALERTADDVKAVVQFGEA
jgi:hypothetical protein